MFKSIYNAGYALYVNDTHVQDLLHTSIKEARSIAREYIAKGNKVRLMRLTANIQGYGRQVYESNRYTWSVSEYHEVSISA
jgi:hypothetical protein